MIEGLAHSVHSQNSTSKANPFLSQYTFARIVLYRLHTLRLIDASTKVGTIEPETKDKTGGWRSGFLLLGICLGRYLTCVVFQAVLLIGLVLLSLSTQEFMLEPKGCGKIGEMCNQPSPPKVAIFYISIYMLALGSGAIEPALATLGADQFDDEDSQENKSKTTFFSYYYVALNLGSLIAETVLVYIENLGKWVLAFWISTCCGLLALVFLLSGTTRYRQIRPSGNPISRFCQVVVACIRKLKIDVPSHGEGLYEVHSKDDKKCAGRISHTNDFKCLDKAAVMAPSDKILLSGKGQTPNPWHLCTVTQVEEVKCVLRLLPIWFCSIVASIVFVQVLSLFVEQGSSMNTQITSNFHIAPASMTAFDIISTSTFIICYEKAIVPLYIKLTKKELKTPSELQRMGIGMVISIIAMIVAGVVEQCRLKHANDGKETSSLSIFWQIPQYVLVGVSEAFIYVAQWELFASQIPDGLKSLGLGLSMSSSALGSYLCTIMVTLVMKVTSQNGKPGWIPPNLNEGHMDRFFFLSAALITFDLAIFIACANRFKCMKLEKQDEGKETPALP